MVELNKLTEENLMSYQSPFIMFVLKAGCTIAIPVSSIQSVQTDEIHRERTIIKYLVGSEVKHEYIPTTVDTVCATITRWYKSEQKALEASTAKNAPKPSDSLEKPDANKSDSV